MLFGEIAIVRCKDFNVEFKNNQQQLMTDL